jgi:hypothetical protein
MNPEQLISFVLLDNFALGGGGVSLLGDGLTGFTVTVFRLSNYRSIVSFSIDIH